MKLTKLLRKLENNRLDIVGVTLLSTEEAEKLPLYLREYSDWWWLRSSGNFQGGAACVCSDGSIYYEGRDTTNYMTVRPALILEDLKLSNFAIGDGFLFGNKEFVIISDTLALCTTDIGVCKFRKNCDTPSNDYKLSDIKKFIGKWFYRNKK